MNKTNMWKDISTAPKDGTHILLRYYKHKANWGSRAFDDYFITEGFWRFDTSYQHDHETNTGQYITSTVDGAWLDYATRLIQKIPSNSKNKVTHWMEIPEFKDDNGNI